MAGHLWTYQHQIEGADQVAHFAQEWETGLLGAGEGRPHHLFHTLSYLQICHLGHQHYCYYYRICFHQLEICLIL